MLQTEEALCNSYFNGSSNSVTKLINLSGVVINIAAQMSIFTWEVQFSKNELNWAGYSTRVLKDLQDSLHFK
jgi:hypothetical protein